MPSRRWFRWSLGGLTLMGLAWACQDASRLVTPSKAPTTRPAFDASAPGAPKKADFVVCKYTPVGTSGNFQIDIYESFPANTPPFTKNFGFYLASGECHL